MHLPNILILMENFFIIGYGCPAYNIRMTIDIFRCRMHHYICALASSGFCKAGDKNVLSTATKASHALGCFCIFVLISTACKRGLDGVSIHIKSGLDFSVLLSLQKRFLALIYKMRPLASLSSANDWKKV